MKHEKSCGAVVWTMEKGRRHYLLVRSIHSHFGLPKGHTEKGEAEAETALREIREETGLRVQLDTGFRAEDEHVIPHKPDTLKMVVYFTAFYEKQFPVYQPEELSGYVLAPYEEAMNLLAKPTLKSILEAAERYLSQKD